MPLKEDDTAVIVPAAVLRELVTLLKWFYEPRKHLCSCSDGPLCEICRVRNVLGKVKDT